MKNKKSKKILVINDDSEDILALQAQMPPEVELVALSQFQAQCSEMFNADLEADLVVLDNDANNLKQSKGKDTLLHIKKQNPDSQVVYTSFQPGWVPAEVYQTKGVSVIKTDALPAFLAQKLGITLKPVKKTNKPEAQTNVILTYNPVYGYEQGVHGNGKLVIASYDKMAKQLARQVMMEHLQKLYKQFDWKADKDLVRNIFVYDGINGGDTPGFAAASLGHDLRMRVHVMACSCEWDRKRQFANSMYVNLHEVECGGRETLGAIADVILGIKRPGVDYAKLPISLDAILAESEKFKM